MLPCPHVHLPVHSGQQPTPNEARIPTEDCQKTTAFPIDHCVVKTARTRRLPWSAQGLHVVGSMVGVRPVAEAAQFINSSRSAAGGWRSSEEWEAALRSHLPPSSQVNFKRTLIGRYCTPTVAITLLRSAKALSALATTPERTVQRMVFARWVQWWAHRRRIPEKSSIIFSPGTPITFSYTANAWLPSSGCLHSSSRWPVHLRRPHRANQQRHQPLPFVAIPPVFAPHHADFAAATLRSYAQCGFLQRWNWDWGYPTVLSSYFVNERVTGAVDIKLRLVIDYRYTNGTVHSRRLSSHRAGGSSREARLHARFSQSTPASCFGSPRLYSVRERSLVL